MELVTKTRTIEIVANMRNIAKLKESTGERNLRRFFSETLQNLDTDYLAKAIVGLSSGDITFNAAQDFIDEYMKENDLYDLCDKVAQEVNQAGFFGKRYSAEELKTELSQPIIDLQDLTTKQIEKQLQAQMPTIKAKK